MNRRQLIYIGQIGTPSGLQPFWDTGKVASTVDLAQAMGFQVAISEARGKAEARTATELFLKWMDDFVISIGLTAGENAFFALAADGRILVNRPEVEDRASPKGGGE